MTMLGPAPFEQQGKKKSSAESTEASGQIGEITPDQAAEIERAVAEMSKLRDGLRKSGQSKLKELEALERANDAHLVLLAKMQAKGNFSQESFDAEEASTREKEEQVKREMKKYFDDADELEERVRAAQIRLGRGVN